MAGAATLMVANAISKILGAVFKIPLTYILHEDGMAVFGVAFQVYIMFLTFIISGFPLAVSKSVSEALAKKNERLAHNTVRVSSVVLCIIGILGTAILYFGAEFFAFALKEEKAVFAIKCISPAVFLVAAGTAYKSYYQGSSNMIPTAVSQVTEAFVKLAAGYFLAAALISGGAYMSAGGAILGVTAGELVASAMLVAMYMYERRKVSLYYESGERRQILKTVLSVAVPVLAAAVISNAMSLAETTIIRTGLLSAGLGEEKARYIYGAYTGYAMTVFNLPSGILATLGVSILPIISGATASGNAERAAKAALSGIRLTIYLALPCAVVMYLMPEEILGVLFRNTASANMLKASAPCIVLLCVTQITAAVMQASGRITEPIIFMFIGAAVKLFVSALLIKRPEFNIYGAVIAANVGYLVTVTINTSAVKKYLSLKYDIMSIIIKPAVSAAAMFAVMRLLKAPLADLPSIAGLACICAAGGAVYMCMLLLTGAVGKNEISKVL